MQRLLELIFGVQRSATDAGTDQSVGFNPPTWMGGHAPLINALLVIAALAIVVLIYRRESRRRSVRVGLGALRMLAFAYVIMLLNRPVLRVTETYTEPSVLAVLIDDSISMLIRDVDPNGITTPSPPTTAPSTTPSTRPGAATRPDAVAAMNIGGSGPTRLEAAIDLLNGQDQALLRRLGQTHTVRVYGFDKDARAIGSTAGAPAAVDGKAPPVADAAKAAIDPKLVEAIGALRPEGRSTQVVPSLLTVLDDLQGQRLAGAVIITDARETPTAASPALIDKLKKYNAKIYPVAVGSEESPTNIEVVALSMQDSAFKDDLVSAKISVRGTGYAAGHPVRLRLKNIKTGAVLKTGDGRPAEVDVKLPDSNPTEAEIVFKPADVGALDLAAEAELQAGELDDKDNVRIAQVAVLDAQINVLYVEDYPRWEYRYVKNEMIRDRTVNVSCLLLGADERFAQEGDRPDPDLGDKHPETGSKFPGAITRFPERMEELMKYDVVLLGDVDARKLTDAQLQMISDFVNKKGGGFGMVAGPRHAPIGYRNTAIEAVLPVALSPDMQPEDPSAEYREGWRPVITDEGRRGEASTIFRFFEDRARNDEFLKSGLQPLFWFAQGVAVKQGAGLVYAEHPMATDPTGRKAPILVLGRFGAGRTLFSAIDDSWRWRYYTGEPVFDNYWVQQLRYLARSRKLGQRKVRFSVDRSSYELGDRVQIDLKVLDPVLLTQLPPQLRIDILDDKGQLVRQETLVRAESPADLYAVTFTADAVGRYTIKLSQALGDAKDAGALELPIEVIVPRLELAGPELDRAMLSRLAPPEQIVPIAEARAKLPEIIKSAARTRAETTPIPLWDRWRALWIFAGLLTAEWVLRKLFGMI